MQVWFSGQIEKVRTKSLLNTETVYKNLPFAVVGVVVLDYWLPFRVRQQSLTGLWTLDKLDHPLHVLTAV